MELSLAGGVVFADAVHPPVTALNEMDALALWIAGERAEGGHSQYAPYIACLPGGGADTAFRWSEERMSATIKVDLFKRKALAMKDAVAQRAAELPAWAALTYEQDVSLVQSRVFSVVRRGGDAKWKKAPALVPFADMMNLGMGDSVTADCRTNEDSTMFECFATKDVPRGHELLVPIAGLPADPAAHRDHVWHAYGFDCGLCGAARTEL